jgi:hypothetical protein
MKDYFKIGSIGHFLLYTITISIFYYYFYATPFVTYIILAVAVESAVSSKQAMKVASGIMLAVYSFGALFYQIGSKGILADKVAHLFGVPNGMSLWGITGVLGALLGAMVGLLAYEFWFWTRKLIPKHD